MLKLWNTSEYLGKHRRPMDTLFQINRNWVEFKARSTIFQGNHTAKFLSDCIYKCLSHLFRNLARIPLDQILTRYRQQEIVNSWSMIVEIRKQKKIANDCLKNTSGYLFKSRASPDFYFSTLSILESSNFNVFKFSFLLGVDLIFTLNRIQGIGFTLFLFLLFFFFKDRSFAHELDKFYEEIFTLLLLHIINWFFPKNLKSPDTVPS